MVGLGRQKQHGLNHLIGQLGLHGVVQVGVAQQDLKLVSPEVELLISFHCDHSLPLSCHLRRLPSGRGWGTTITTMMCDIYNFILNLYLACSLHLIVSSMTSVCFVGQLVTIFQIHTNGNI